MSILETIIKNKRKSYHGVKIRCITLHPDEGEADFMMFNCPKPGHIIINGHETNIDSMSVYTRDGTFIWIRHNDDKRNTSPWIPENKIEERRTTINLNELTPENEFSLTGNGFELKLLNNDLTKHIKVQIYNKDHCNLLAEIIQK